MTKNIYDDEALRKEIWLKAKNDYDKELTDVHISMCILTMEHKRVSFLAGHLYPNEVQGKLTWDLTADGRRCIAHQHGLAGVEPTVWKLAEDGSPLEATVTVLRRFVYDGGRSITYERFTGTARWDEFVGTKYNGEVNYQWTKRPFNQLAKCGEMQALRRGFPEGQFVDENGMYDDDVPEAEDAMRAAAAAQPEPTPAPAEPEPEPAGDPRPEPPETEDAPPLEPLPPPKKALSIEQLKEDGLPILKKYCEAFNEGKGMSWREAYKRTTGVVENKDMDVNDYSVLVSAMRDELEAASKTG